MYNIEKKEKNINILTIQIETMNKIAQGKYEIILSLND